MKALFLSKTLYLHFPCPHASTFSPALCDSGDASISLLSFLPTLSGFQDQPDPGKGQMDHIYAGVATQRPAEMAHSILIHTRVGML